MRGFFLFLKNFMIQYKYLFIILSYSFTMSNIYKKAFSFLLIIVMVTGLWFFTNTTHAASGYQKKFIVTAYYSPLPNQTHYIMWSYAAEIRMNGKGIRGASWKKVFSWMLAAPQNYAFGTKIALSGLGIGEVADRGGAIVKAWERNFAHDRIDVWVWWWEAWLQRAMYWWNRVVEWTIMPRWSKPTLNMYNIPAPRWTITYARKNPHYNKVWTAVKPQAIIAKKVATNTDIFSWPISNQEGVKRLQEILQRVKLYNWKIDGQYISIRAAVLKFQLQEKVIPNSTSPWAGNFWPSTRKALKIFYNESLAKETAKKLQEAQKKQEEEKAQIAKQKKIELERLAQESRKKEEAAKKAKLQRMYSLELVRRNAQIKRISNIKVWTIAHEVRELQLILKELWFFSQKDTAIFWEQTKQALIAYQIDKKLIENKNSKWAGTFGPATKKSLAEDLAQKTIYK